MGALLGSGLPRASALVVAFDSITQPHFSTMSKDSRVYDSILDLPSQRRAKKTRSRRDLVRSFPLIRSPDDAASSAVDVT